MFYNGDMEEEQTKTSQSTRMRYVGILIALVVLVQMGMHNITLGALAFSAYQNLANVSSLSASVLPNPYNSLAMQFEQKEQELNARAQELSAEEAALNDRITAESKKQWLLISVLIGLVILLLVLLVLNFYFDIKREEAREEQAKPDQPTDLSTTL
jgi:flagellar basal body-associated protein FliL